MKPQGLCLIAAMTRLLRSLSAPEHTNLAYQRLDRISNRIFEIETQFDSLRAADARRML
jgi:hypothetical protein